MSIPKSRRENKIATAALKPDLTRLSYSQGASRHFGDAGSHGSGDKIPNRANDWSVMDVEDLRDYAKVMAIDDLEVLLMRSRYEIQKKLLELGISPIRGSPNTSFQR